MYKTLSHWSFFTSASLTIALLAALPVRAAIVNYNFQGFVTDGPLVGINYSGNFSFDDLKLIGENDEFLEIETANIIFLNKTLTKIDASAKPEVSFLDGEFIGLNFSYQDNSISFAFNPGFFHLSEAYFSYTTSSNNAGFGNVNFTKNLPITTTPEPIGLGSLLLIGTLFAQKSAIAKR
jgi:hypothetical protein